MYEEKDIDIYCPDMIKDIGEICKDELPECLMNVAAVCYMKGYIRGRIVAAGVTVAV